MNELIKKNINWLRWSPSRIQSLLLLWSHGVVCKEAPKTKGTFFIRNHGVISIGCGVSLNSSLEANPVFGEGRTVLIAEKGAALLIGDHTGISNAVLYARRGICIGRNVLIGSGVKILDSDFHSLDYRSRKLDEYDRGVSREITIGDHVFIGAGAIVLKGVSIGLGSVIGAGSVVASRVPAGEIWAGNPAKFIKSLI
jgi:acetyltransferase-like isoleucine patch superfamily enzyme